MKKIFTLCAAVLFAAGMFAEGYGIAVNGQMYYAGTQNPNPLDPTFQEYMVLGLSVQAGDNLQLWDPSGNNGSGAGWAVNLDGASTANIRRDGDHYVCEVAGCYDFYIKLKFEQDQLYIGEGECGSPTGVEISGTVTPPTPQPGGAKDYFLKGYFNGKDIDTPTADEQFEGGILEYTFTGDASGLGYFFILVCEQGQVVGDCYMTAEYTTASHCTLVKEDGTHNQKMAVPQGTVTFYLYDNGDGSLELSTEPLPGKTLVGGTEGVENTRVDNKAYKTIINGQLVIIRGEKMFDATGRQL